MTPPHTLSSIPHRRSQALDIASLPKISGLGLSPVCDATLKLIRDASALWSPATHYAYPDAHRAAVFTVLLVANRQLVEGCKGYLTTAMVGGEVIDVPLAPGAAARGAAA